MYGSDHIVNCGLCSKECFIIALIYVERILQKEDGFQITRRNVHSLILVNLMLASKMLDDFYCRNKYYADAGGLTLELLNDFEVKICFMLNFDFNVTVDEFELYRSSLRRSETTPMPPVAPANGSRIFDKWGKPIGIQMPILTTPQSFVATKANAPQMVNVGPGLPVVQPVQPVVYASSMPMYPNVQLPPPQQQQNVRIQQAVQVPPTAVPAGFYANGDDQLQSQQSSQQAHQMHSVSHDQSQNYWVFAPLAVATPPMQVLPRRVDEVRPDRLNTASGLHDWNSIGPYKSKLPPSQVAVSAPSASSFESTASKSAIHVPIRTSSLSGRPKPAGKSQKPNPVLSLPAAYQTMFPTLVDNLLPSSTPAWLLA